MIGGIELVAGEVIQVVDRIMYRREVLYMSRRFKALHNPLASSDRLMRILCPIVQTGLVAWIAVDLIAIAFLSYRGGVDAA